jgi:peptide chain release factor subunit 1
MHVSAPERDYVRRLVELSLDRPVVLSLYVDLDPAEFATLTAKATAVRSVLDQAERSLRDRDGLSHQDRRGLDASLERARAFLEPGPPADGAHALAVFASEAAGLFETVKLPRSVPSRVAIGRSPLVGPLASLEWGERWCVALVNRRDARVLRGSPHGLREVASVRDEVHRRHDQGGWSQARFQRSVDKEVADHLRHAADVLFQHFKLRPFERLLVGGPAEIVPDFEGKLHGYLQERLAGRVDVDVETANTDQVLSAALPRMEEVEEEREGQAMERLEAGWRAVAGLEDVLPPLNERRVEVLLFDERFSAPGAECPRCGWLGPSGHERCPVDDTPLERLDDVTEAAIELALRQSADVLPIRSRVDDLRARGGIAALLRF